ncbi:MAG TPA: hypothetical protein VFZ56_06620 [Gemmatimonadaceae bacterium]
MTVTLASPPYALAPVEFQFPALAALAARVPVGGEREAVLACITLGRLASALLPPVELSSELRRERAEGARIWLLSLPLEPTIRALLLRAINSTASATRAELAAEIELIRERLEGALDAASGGELQRLTGELRR